MMSDKIEWVDNDSRLRALCTQWRQAPAIALDTEFIRTRTFYPRIGLLQVTDGQGVYLIDPLAITDRDALRSVMQDYNVTKVIHSCSEDLEVFDRYLSVLPSPLFDTQVAAAFAGYGASISYANLVQTISGDAIAKQETRSDWLQRPLSQSQLTYAALDVEHLLPIYKQLCERLQQMQRLQWVETDCQQLIDKAQSPNDLSDYYQRIKSAWKLKPKQLAALRILCQWREQEVRHIDKPRNHLVKDSSLLDMARVLPKEAHQLYRLRDVQPRFVNRYGEQCIELIQEAIHNTGAYPPALPKPLDSRETALFKRLKQRVVEVAEQLSIPPEHLARKKDLEALVLSASQNESTLPPAFDGWRRSVIGDALAMVIEE